jgi:hypothetical protein
MREWQKQGVIGVSQINVIMWYGVYPARAFPELVISTSQTFSTVNFPLSINEALPHYIAFFSTFVSGKNKGFSFDRITGK